MFIGAAEYPEETVSPSEYTTAYTIYESVDLLRPEKCVSIVLLDCFRKLFLRIWLIFWS